MNEHVANYPNIVAAFGIAWLSKWAGHLTETELQRQEKFIIERKKDKAHEAECRIAVESLIAEREQVRS